MRKYLPTPKLRILVIVRVTLTLSCHMQSTISGLCSRIIWLVYRRIFTMSSTVTLSVGLTYGRESMMDSIEFPTETEPHVTALNASFSAVYVTLAWTTLLNPSQ
jgi:hypothetical protein